jgi:hypothetical protein
MTRRPSQRGVSLVEALVAMAVMAVGLLGLVGLQATMRQNADIAKQRSEAVRIAQERIEQWRGYTTLAQYRNAVVSAAAGAASAPPTTNTAYTLSAVVAPAPPNPPTTPPLKSGTVTVGWTDRAGAAQQVLLTTRIAGISPELGGALAAPNAEPATQPQGRNPGIPPGAVNQSNGTSQFVPPGSSVGWVFNNTTGDIQRQCDPGFSSCVDVNLRVMWGYVRFATGSLQPTPEQAATPPSLAFGSPVEVRVRQSQPGPQTIDCFVAAPSPAWNVYYCALPLSPATLPSSWSGRTELRGFNIVSNLTDDDDDKFRVCRYTPERSNTPAGGNIAHPLNYTEVSGPLPNQNYLIIRAGDDENPFLCPADASGDAVNTNTYDHQPVRP